MMLESRKTFRQLVRMRILRQRLLYYPQAKPMIRLQQIMPQVLLQKTALKMALIGCQMFERT